LIIGLSTLRETLFIPCEKSINRAGREAEGLQLYEFVVTILLLAPLGITLIVLTVSFIGAGLRDLANILAREEPEMPEIAPEGDVGEYIEELKKEKNLKADES
jgi:hypothetical protein